MATPAHTPAADRELVWVSGCLGAIATTLLLWGIYGAGATGLDGQHALLWGQQISAGRTPELGVPLAPTPHPLTILLGGVLATLGGIGGGALALAHHASVALLAVAVWVFAAEMFDRWVGVLAVALLALSPFVTASAAGMTNTLYVAGLLIAGRSALRGEHRLALTTIGVLGLLRPEAWVLAGAYCLWLWREPSGRRWLWTLAAILPPALWLGFDWVLTGDPLWSFHGTRDFREALARDTGLMTAVEAIPSLVQEVIGGPVAAAGLAGLALALVDRARGVLGVLAGAGLVLTLFIILSASGFSVIPAYLLPVAVILAVFAGALLRGGVGARIMGGRSTAALAAAVGVAVLVQLPATAEAHRETQAALKRHETALTDLQAVISADDLDASCGPADVPGPVGWRPLAALWLDVPLRDLRDGTLEAPRDGLHVRAIDPWVREVVTAPAFVHHTPDPPGEGRLIRRNASWGLWEVC